jgi:Uma2 family endonuclease
VTQRASQNTHDARRLLPAYAQMGVRQLWLVDPGAETLEVFRLEGLHWGFARSSWR